MLLCQACHWKSPCRSEVHLGIVRAKCATCGCILECFDCPNTSSAPRRAGCTQELIRMYRNTQQVRYKK